MDKICCHQTDFYNELKKVKDWNIATLEKKKIKEFFSAYARGEITNRVSESPDGSFLRYLYFLKVCLDNTPKFDKKNIQKFVDDLFSNEINNRGEPYSMRTKKDTLVLFSKYVSWRVKNGEELVKILRVNIKLKKKDFTIYGEEQRDLFISLISQLDKKYFVSVLALGGMRIEEFFNIRMSDWTFPEKEDVYLDLRIRDEFTKTEGRTITFFNKDITPIVKEFYYQREKEGAKPEDPVFTLGYSSMRKWLMRNSKKLINITINCHLFRKNRATELAHTMNRQQLCIYFGWQFSSNMPDIYIKRAGVNMDEVKKRFESTDMETLENEIKQLKSMFMKFAKGEINYSIEDDEFEMYDRTLKKSVKVGKIDSIR